MSGSLCIPGYLIGLFAMSRHHVFVKMPRQVELAEVGPRFEMKRAYSFLLLPFPSPLTKNKAYEIRQGTIEQTEADREWVLAHYARTSKKRSLLSGGGSSYGKPSVVDSNPKPTKKAKR